jgi:hypothetical protein
MNVNEAFPSKFLKASDIGDAQPTVTMKEVVMEDIGEDRRPILYFVGKDKGVVLNKTNATNISAAYGPDTDDWTGKKVILFTAWVDFQGKSVEAIRIRPAKDGATAPKLPPASHAPAFESGGMDDDIPFAPEMRG